VKTYEENDASQSHRLYTPSAFPRFAPPFRAKSWDIHELIVIGQLLHFDFFWCA
jgi:hypothetical protein